MLKLSNKKYIWIIGVPRSGTTFLTDYLCQHTDACYNEPWENFDHKLINQWEFPNVKSITFKYCVNWSYAEVLNNKFKKSYFIHLIRNPAQVVYSLVFPKIDAYPFRDIFKDQKFIKDKFNHAIERWYSFICGSQDVYKKYKGIEIVYENINKQIDKLSEFLDIPLKIENLNFQSRNNINVNFEKFEKLETLWQSYPNELKKRKEIELNYY